MKNIFLLSFMVAHFIYGLVFSLILLYSSPDNAVYPLESSIYSLGSAFFILITMSSVSFGEEANMFMKILFITYGLYFIACYIVLGLINIYAPPGGHTNANAMAIYIFALVMILIGIVSLFVKEKKREPRCEYLHIVIVAIILVSGVFVGINEIYTGGSILFGSYYFLATSVMVFLGIFFCPIDALQNTKWLFYVMVTLFGLLSFLMTFVSLYVSPNTLVNPLASAVFFIASMVTLSSASLDFKYLSVYEKLNNGKFTLFLKILFFIAPILMFIQNQYQRM